MAFRAKLVLGEVTRMTCCEICNKRKCSDSTVCGPCDNRMKRMFEREDVLRAKAWAKNHKCRRCKKGLPLDRYFECHKCDVPSLRESDGEFDGMADVSGWDKSPRKPYGSRVNLKLAVPKVCFMCNLAGDSSLKQPNEFPIQPEKKDGLGRNCKPCAREMARARHHAKRAEEMANVVS